MMSWMESKVFIHWRCERSICSKSRKFSTAMASCSAQVCRKSSSSVVQERFPEFEQQQADRSLLADDGKHDDLTDFFRLERLNRFEGSGVALCYPRFRLLQQL